MSAAQVAGALSKSRQTVNRGIQSPSDYLKPADLAKALEFWRQSDSHLYSIAKTTICSMYPEFAGAILAAAEGNGSPTFSTTIPGEYWFICGDFVGFRNSLTACSGEIEKLCENEDAQVKLFVSERDKVAASRLSVRFKENNTQIFVCNDPALQVAPSTLLRTDYDDNIDLFGASDAGFIPLSRQEAGRLRFVMQDLERKYTN